MATYEYKTLLDAGYSKRFLLAPYGSPALLRRAYIMGRSTPRRCIHCQFLYSIPSELPHPATNRDGKDFRFMYSGNPLGSGFCSYACLRDFGRDNKAESIEYAIKLSAQPDFYQSEEWRILRYKVLHKRGRKCELCGAEYGGKRIHVDHIRPKSKYPYLALTESNLQILCDDCNMGKGAMDETDWRGQ